MCDLSVKVTREARARPLASRNSFRERYQGAPSGCASFFIAPERNPDYSRVKASCKALAILDAVRNPVQLLVQCNLSQLHNRTVTKVRAGGMNDANVRPRIDGGREVC